MTASSKFHEVWNYVLLTELPWLRPLWFSVSNKSLSSRYDRQTDKRSWQTEKRSWQTEKNIPYRQTKTILTDWQKKRSWLTEKRSWQRETDKCQRQTDKTAFPTQKKRSWQRDTDKCSWQTDKNIPDWQSKKHSWQIKKCSLLTEKRSRQTETVLDTQTQKVNYWQKSIPDRETDKCSWKTDRQVFLTDREISVPDRQTERTARKKLSSSKQAKSYEILRHLCFIISFRFTVVEKERLLCKALIIFASCGNSVECLSPGQKAKDFLT